MKNANNHHPKYSVMMMLIERLKRQSCLEEKQNNTETAANFDVKTIFSVHKVPF